MKGSVLDIIFMTLVITIIPLVFVSSHYVLSALAPTILNSDGYITNGLSALENYNIMFPMIYFVLGITSIILSSRISVHPVLAGMYVILYALLGVYVAQISNVYQVIEDSGVFSASFSAFSNVGMLHDNIVIISLTFLILIGITMFSKGGTRISE